MQILIDPSRPDAYDLFLKVKRLPTYRFVGHVAEFPDEYAGLITPAIPATDDAHYVPHPLAYDYQAAIAGTAIRKQKYAVFADCGLGKTMVIWEYARHCAATLPPGKAALIVSPLMVVRQSLNEFAKFYPGDQLPTPLRANELGMWLESGTGRIGITNYEAITDKIKAGRLGALILDESSMLKSHYGRWGQRLIRLGRGLDWKLCLTGTPAPNDRIEYANHAVFLDQFPTVNAFLARFFVNRGETQNRWELKPHALRPFYRALSHWCIFLNDPATYGWKGCGRPTPPIRVHIHDVPMTRQQTDGARDITGNLFADPGGFVQRTRLSRLAKGIDTAGKQSIKTNKPVFVRDLVRSFGDESSIVWCNYNREQSHLAKMLAGCASIAGDTPHDKRSELIESFQAGVTKTLLSKPRVLGFGLNLQVASRHVFSSLVDSYESYYQAVKRSNRIGSGRDLDVHIPVTEIERPMAENVLRKAARVQADTEEQERLFKELANVA